MKTLQRTISCRVLACAALATLAGCNKSSDDVAPPDKAARKSFAESFPIRNVFVSYQKDPSSPKRSEKETVARINEALTKVRAPGGSFEAVAQEMSDDTVSAVDGGFVGFIPGWLTNAPDDAYALVERAQALKPGEISAPFATSIGWQIIQRLSREEGKAVEEKVIAPIVGFVVPWHDLLKSLPVSATKEAAYEDTARMVVAIRAGDEDVVQAAGKLLGAQALEFPMRHATSPTYAKLSEAVFASNVGDVTDPIETKDGWVVARRIRYVRCYAHHVVVTSEASPPQTRPSKRTTAEARALVSDALARLKREPGAFGELVRGLSEEPGSKALGGFAGDFSTCSVPNQRGAPELEAAIWTLKPGETSDVVETRFGFHIIRRDD